MTKIKMSTPKSSLINNVGIPANSLRKETLAISDLVANIHIYNEATPKMSPVIMSKNITEMQVDGSTMDSLHVKTGYRDRNSNTDVADAVIQFIHNCATEYVCALTSMV